MKPTTFAAVSVWSLKIENGTSGSFTRCSQTTNARRRTAASAKTAIVVAEPQPHPWPCVMPRTRVERPEVTRTAPGMSNPWPCLSRLSERRKGLRISAAMPTGTLTKKIHGHERKSTRMPPKSTPKAAPTPPTAPQPPSAMLRSRPSLKVATRMDSAAGVMVAAPSPWNARKAMRDASLQASPQRSEPSVKTTAPKMNTRRRPSRSAERPPSRRKPPNTSAYALMTHCRFSCVNLRSSWMDESATLTIAMSRMVMNCTARMSPSANHFLLSEPTMETPVPALWRLECAR